MATFFPCGARCPHDGLKEGSHVISDKQVGFYPFRGPDASCTQIAMVQASRARISRIRQGSGPFVDGRPPHPASGLRTSTSSVESRARRAATFSLLGEDAAQRRMRGSTAGTGLRWSYPCRLSAVPGAGPSTAGQLDRAARDPRDNVAADESVIALPLAAFAYLLGLPDPTLLGAVSGPLPGPNPLRLDGQGR